MTDYVRIKDPATGAEYTYDTAKVEALGLQDHVIDKEALGPDGMPAPAKPHMPLGEPLPGSAPDRRRAAKKTANKAAEKTPGTPDPGENAGQTSATPAKEN